MSVFHPAFLGFIQGISEFLPISSSAHLVIVPYLFRWQYQGLAFDVALHFGTLLAIIAYFWKDWVVIIANAIRPNHVSRSTYHAGEDKVPDTQYAIPNTNTNYPRNLLWVILIATIPGIIAGVLLESFAATAFRSPLLIAINLFIFGIIIWAIDRYATTDYKLQTIDWKSGLIIGFAQMLAIVPGVSRSGSTMAAGRAIGLTRPDSARFSFLLAAPIMLGSAIFELKNISEISFDFSFVLAMATSLIFGFIAIKYLLKYLQRGNYAIFTWYRAVIAIIVIIVYVLR